MPCHWMEGYSCVTPWVWWYAMGEPDQAAWMGAIGGLVAVGFTIAIYAADKVIAWREQLAAKGEQARLAAQAAQRASVVLGPYLERIHKSCCDIAMAVRASEWLPARPVLPDNFRQAEENLTMLRDFPDLDQALYVSFLHVVARGLDLDRMLDERPRAGESLEKPAKSVNQFDENVGSAARAVNRVRSNARRFFLQMKLNSYALDVRVIDCRVWAKG